VMLAALSQQLNLPVVATGLHPFRNTPPCKEGACCPFIARDWRALGAAGGSQEDRFPNLELLETDDETVYFDAQPGGSFLWPPPSRSIWN